jgi:hypothetical protein
MERMLAIAVKTGENSLVLTDQQFNYVEKERQHFIRRGVFLPSPGSCVSRICGTMVYHHRILFDSLSIVLLVPLRSSSLRKNADLQDSQNRDANLVRYHLRTFREVAEWTEVASILFDGTHISIWDLTESHQRRDTATVTLKESMTSAVHQYRACVLGSHEIYFFFM